ncbi:MAG: ATP-dependent DNA helicase [Clostridia bacterium]|nr:ATP-dependent DNA helicase [Clostridia bacterium]
MNERKLAVRELVEFSLHGEDITPGGSLREMREGSLGHRARQALLPKGWQAEVPLSLTLVADADTSVCLTGRMDAVCLEGDCPEIEEIKLWSAAEPPSEARSEHLAQAQCYAHMLCVRDGLERVSVRVTYVTIRGEVRAAFCQEMTAAEAAEAFRALWENWLQRFRLLKAHAARRDECLRALAFPFDRFRPGQRELAAQVYTAIRRGKRLFASMPTGTGKSAAVLFPALKALAEGHTGRVFQLTARTTQRQGPLDALERMRARQPLGLWTLILDAKDKQCPARTLCDPVWCERAKGHFLRDGEAIAELLETEMWTPEVIREAADRHSLCPFELSLSLAELADVTICDYNYALDPAVHIQRIFDREKNVTLLIDEAHHLPERLRDMLSGAVDGGTLRQLRTVIGKTLGRRGAAYKALGKLLHALRELPVEAEAQEGVLENLPEDFPGLVTDALEALLDLGAERQRLDAGEALSQAITDLLGLQRALKQDREGYAFLWEGRQNRRLTALALDVGSHFAAVTEALRGTVCYSATLQPLEGMRLLLGSGEEDASFALPSPFPPENLLVVQMDVGTRYHQREETAAQVAAAIETMYRARPGRYIAFFPSFRYLALTAEFLKAPCRVQRSGMTEEERRDFLAPFRPDGEDCLALCVLGGVFAEGIDLPGSALHGVMIVGMGLPQVGLRQETLRRWYQQAFGDGFRFAYQLPGMQKVAQAAGRVIRSETDRGAVLLLDDRYRQRDWLALCPPHWRIRRVRDEGELAGELERFWAGNENETDTSDGRSSE